MATNDPQPSVTIPNPGGDSASPALMRSFWVLILLFKGTLLTSTLGILLLIFRHQIEIGSGLLAIGFAAFLLLIHRYRRVRARLQNDSASADSTNQ